MVESVGLLFPVLMLLASIVAVVIHGQRHSANWFLLAWSAALVVAFLVRYKARKVGSMPWELHFGFWLTGAPTFIVIAFQYPSRFQWLEYAVFGLGFVYNAASYVKRFYLSERLAAKG
jgi:hypothetical protein